MKRSVSIVLAVLMLLLLVGCGSTPTPSASPSASAVQSQTPTSQAPVTSDTPVTKVEKVKIGVCLPFTGGTSRMGELSFAGYMLKFEEVNEAGGIKSLGGAKIEIIKADSMSKADVGVTEVERLITQEKIDVLMGPYASAIGAATAPVAERYGVPYLLSSCTADAILQNGYKYVFRGNNSNSTSALDMFKFLKDLKDTSGKGPQTFAIIHEQTDWGKGVAATCAPMVKDVYGGELILTEAYETGLADASPIINKIKTAKPDCVLFASYLNDALLFTKGFADYKVDSMIIAFGGGFSTTDYPQQAGAAGDNVIALSSWNPGLLEYKPARATELNNKYKAQYGIDLDEYSANGYLAASIVCDVLERAATLDKDKIRDAFAATDWAADDPNLVLHPYKGLKFGEINGMTNQGLNSDQIFVQIKDGAFKLVGPLHIVSMEKSGIVWPVPTYATR